MKRDQRIKGQCIDSVESELLREALRKAAIENTTGVKGLNVKVYPKMKLSHFKVKGKE